MREIKFRAWDEREEDCYGQAVTPKYIYDIQNTYDNEQGYSFEEVLETDGLIIEQFTGLHDKNGKEIYEGDVVRITAFEDDGDIFIHRIYWNDASASFKTYGRTDGWDMTVTPESTEIIGNIHENPELLEASC